MLSLVLSIFIYAVSLGDSAIVLSDSLREDIVISAVRAAPTTPVTQVNLSRQDIQLRNFGADFPQIIQYTPSIITQSDGGLGFGYTYFRIRGIDFTRINFNVNGIPINDPENQGFFTYNFADLAASAQQIQIQRGVGTTANGTAPLAGSINICTYDLQNKAQSNFALGYGNFNSYRLMAEAGTGKLKNNLSAYIRLSQIGTEGYRDHSGSLQRSYFTSFGYLGNKTIVKFNFWGGASQSELSFYPVDKSTLEANRRFNPLSGKETDAFQQLFNQAQLTHRFNERFTVHNNTYYVYGHAPRFALNFVGFPYYFANMPDVVSSDGSTQSASDMLVSYRLRQHLIGNITSGTLKLGNVQLDMGIHANRFQSDHFMEILEANPFPVGFSAGHLAYFNTGFKNEASAFAKATYSITPRLSLFGDVQWRHTTFQYKAQDKPIYRDTNHVEDMAWTFINPKAGLRYALNIDWNVYASIGNTQREPTRLDYLLDDRAITDVKQNQIHPESVVNIEMGSHIQKPAFRWFSNLFYMRFKNEIVATGAFNAFGYNIRTNGGPSARYGWENSVVYSPTRNLKLGLNATLMRARVDTYTQTYTLTDNAGNAVTDVNGSAIVETFTFKNMHPVLSPEVYINQSVQYLLLNRIELEIIGRYVGKSYAAAHNLPDNLLHAYLVVDSRVGIKLLEKGNNMIRLSLHANNIGNTLYSPGGTAGISWIDDGFGNRQFISQTGYFVAATQNYFATLQFTFK